MKKTINIAGTEYAPRFTFESLCRMQEYFNFNALHESTFEPAPRTVAILAWGAVYDARPAVTLLEIYASIVVDDMARVNRLLIDALIDSLPKKKEADDAASGVS